jgi:hypothetical protein
MEIKDKQTKISHSELEIECDFNIEWDKNGFSINCEVMSGNEHFGEHLIPSIALHYIRELCKEAGITFEQALRASMGMPATHFKGKVEA